MPKVVMTDETARLFAIIAQANRALRTAKPYVDSCVEGEGSPGWIDSAEVDAAIAATKVRREDA